MIENGSEFYTPETLATYLSLPVSTIYSWRHKRIGPPALRVGQHLRNRKRDVEAWLDKQTADTTKAVQ